jgi:hypothetical protein
VGGLEFCGWMISSVLGFYLSYLITGEQSRCSRRFVGPGSEFFRDSLAKEVI